MRLDRTYGPGTESFTWGNSRDVNKALSIMYDPSMENISAQLTGGGKVPSFFNDIAYPSPDNLSIVLDTHSSGATGLFPAGANDRIALRGMGGSPAAKLGFQGAANPASGAKGFYGPFADAHLLSSKELGLKFPFGSQSVTWEGVRDMWGGPGKTQALKDEVSRIWLTSSSPDEARFRIAELVGKPVRRMYEVK